MFPKISEQKWQFLFPSKLQPKSKPKKKKKKKTKENWSQNQTQVVPQRIIDKAPKTTTNRNRKVWSWKKKWKSHQDLHIIYKIGFNRNIN